MAAVIWSVGHSNHPLPRFLALLGSAGVTHLVDVRTTPQSRHFPHFGQKRLRESLAGVGIAYTFAGDALGGRPKDLSLWRNGRPDYDRMAATPAARGALEDLRQASGRAHVCMMCSEKEPLDCHRCLMIGRVLAAAGDDIRHILADGTVEPHAAAEARLMAWAGKRSADLFASDLERRAAAYEARCAWLWRRAGV